MHPLLAIAAALATGLAWSASGAQHVPGARPHPAASAHANALSGATHAVRIEACTLATQRLVDDLESGEFQRAMRNFDAPMRDATSAQQLGALWHSIGARLGPLTRRKPAQNVLYRGLVVITQPLRFERGALGLEAACNANGQFAELRLRPLASAPDTSG